MPDRLPLDSYLGMNIGQVCDNGYTDNHLNHCAHFACHALAMPVGYTCKAQTGGKFPGAGLRVHQLFEHCQQVGRWANKPETLTACLIFITNAANVDVAHKTMVNHPRKHVGIFRDGSVTHYSNTMGCVTRQTVDQFGTHYDPPFNALFFGKVLAAI